jgi:hypothetical protein
MGSSIMFEAKSKPFVMPPMSFYIRLGVDLSEFRPAAERWFRRTVTIWHRQGGDPFNPIPSFTLPLDLTGSPDRLHALVERMTVLMPELRKLAWAYERECRMRVYRSHVTCEDWRPENFYVPRPRKVPDKGFVSSSRRISADNRQWARQWALPYVYWRPRHGWQSDIWLISPTTSA